MRIDLSFIMFWSRAPLQPRAGAPPLHASASTSGINWASDRSRYGGVSDRGSSDPRHLRMNLHRRSNSVQTRATSSSQTKARDVPLISIITVVLNAADTLERTIESVLK